REAEAIPEGNLDVLTAEAEAADRAFFTAERTEAEARSRAAAAREKTDRLRARLAVYPDEVHRTLTELEDRGIGAALLAATVDVADPSRGEAIEAALGDARFALLVEGSAEEEAITAARRHAFPGPVYAGPRISHPERSGPLEIG